MVEIPRILFLKFESFGDYQRGLENKLNIFGLCDSYLENLRNTWVENKVCSYEL